MSTSSKSVNKIVTHVRLHGDNMFSKAPVLTAGVRVMLKSNF